MRMPMVLAVGSLSLASCASVAQEIQECAKDGTCVEFTVRYYRNDRTDKPDRIEIIDPQTKGLLVTKDKCEIGKSCKTKENLVHVLPLTLMQTYNPHYCYQVCYGGWCYIKCPGH